MHPNPRTARKPDVESLGTVRIRGFFPASVCRGLENRVQGEFRLRAKGDGVLGFLRGLVLGVGISFGFGLSMGSWPVV